MLLEYLKQLASSARPVLQLPKRDKWISENYVDEKTENTTAKTKKQYYNIKLTIPSVKRHARTLMIMAHVYTKVLLAGILVTQRDIYYNMLNFFENQTEVNRILLDVGALLDVSRHSMGVVAAARGYIHGNLQLFVGGQDSNVIIDCSNPQLISNSVLEELFIQSDAKYIIVIEKEGIFTNLVKNNFTSRIPSILVLCQVS